MSAREKAKATVEQVVGRAVRRIALAIGHRTTAAKGAALEARGKARRIKEKGKDKLKF
ncbi:hypothetical protein [Streptomyces sp. LN699]|uniref:hypothetical protein n=1 Tax=Streptomyces sp. LN699 TaxID=3112981 RepID=UPI003715D664